MEVTQFTYFQQVGGLDCNPITGEITYGLERLAMYLQGKENVFDLVWTTWKRRRRRAHADLRRRLPPERGRAVDVQLRAVEAAELFKLFGLFEAEAKRLLEAKLPLPGYEMILKAAHTFNLLDARGAISVTERAAYIGRIRTLSRLVAQAYYDSREALGFPMLAVRAEGRLVSDTAGGRAADRGAAAEGAEAARRGLRRRHRSGSARARLPGRGEPHHGYATPRRLAVSITGVARPLRSRRAQSRWYRSMSRSMATGSPPARWTRRSRPRRRFDTAAAVPPERLERRSDGKAGAALLPRTADRSPPAQRHSRRRSTRRSPSCRSRR